MIYSYIPYWFNATILRMFFQKLLFVFSNTSSHTTAELAELFNDRYLRDKFLTGHGYYPFHLNRLFDVMKGKYASNETFTFGVVFAEQILEKTVIALPVDHHGFAGFEVFDRDRGDRLRITRKRAPGGSASRPGSSGPRDEEEDDSTRGRSFSRARIERDGICVGLGGRGERRQRDQDGESGCEGGAPRQAASHGKASFLRLGLWSVSVLPHFGVKATVV